MQDLRFTFRTLRRDCGFTIVAVLILGLGIGANIAVFSVVNTILLRPLPFRDPERLVRIVEKEAGTNESGRTYTADATQDFQEQNRSFQSGAATLPLPHPTTSNSWAGASPCRSRAFLSRKASFKPWA